MPAHVVFNTEDEIDSFFGAPDIWERTITRLGADGAFVDRTTGSIYHEGAANGYLTIDEAILHWGVGPEIVNLVAGVGTELKDFVHPDNAIYVFGRDSGLPDQAKIPNHIVKINTTLPIWGLETMAIVLYDRWSKEQR